MKKENETKNAPPGVMIYRSSRDLFCLLPPEAVKRLVLAMLDYEGPETEPKLDDPVMNLAWTMLRERLDLDRSRYESLCMTNRYKRFLREAQRTMPRDSCPDFETWFELSDKGSLSAARTLLKIRDPLPPQKLRDPLPPLTAVNRYSQI